MKTFYLLLTMLFALNTFGQTVFQISERLDLPFEINHFAVNGDGEMLVLNQNNEVYLIDAASNIDDITEQFNLSAGSQFTVLTGTRSSGIFIGTSKDFLYQYKNGQLKQLGESVGIEGDSITSVYERIIFKSQIYVGTNKEMYLSEDRGNQFEKFDLNEDFPQDFPSVVYDGFSSILTIESQAKRTFSACTGEPNVIVFSFNGIFETSYSIESVPGNVNDRLTISSGNRPAFVMGTDEGIYFRSWECNRPNYFKIADFKVNSFELVTLYSSQIFEDRDSEFFVAINTDNGVYMTDSEFRNYTLIPATADLDVKSSKFNECTGELFLAGNNYISTLTANVDYSIEKVDLFNSISKTGEMFICDGDSIVLESTASSFGSYDLQWIKDGEDIPSANSQNLSVKEAGEYSIRYDHCLFDESQFTQNFTLNYYEREQIEIIGASEFFERTIQTIEIIQDENDSLFYVNDQLLTANTFAIKSDTTVLISALSKDNCTFSREFSFNTVVSINEFQEANQFDVYPNPFTDKIFIKGYTAKVNSVKIFDMLGHELNVGDIEIGKVTIQMNTDKLVSGLYLVRIKTQDGYINRRVLKY